MIDFNFEYSGVELSYDIHYNCDEHGCDMICRCGEIVNSKVKDIDYVRVTDAIYDYFFDKSLSTERDNKLNNVLYDVTKEIDLYTIDRITRHFKLWDKENWDINIENGYYGQEVESVTINESISSRIDDNLKIAFSIQGLTGRIQYLIGLEYGHLLPELEKCDFEIIEIDKSDLIFGSDSQLKKVKSENLSHYSDAVYFGIRGIVINKGNKWRLIDGYHRCYKSNLKKIRVISAVID